MEFIYKKPFLRQFDKYTQKLQQQIITAIEQLPQGDAVKLQEIIPPLYRLRVQKYRILFEMSENKITVWNIDSRGSIYKKLK